MQIRKRCKVIDLNFNIVCDLLFSATVSKVVHKKTNQVYAMKKVNVDLQDQKPKLIVSEFKALYNSGCPYVMTLYDAYYRQGCILMILEFMGRFIDFGMLSNSHNINNRLWIIGGFAQDCW